MAFSKVGSAQAAISISLALVLAGPAMAATPPVFDTVQTGVSSSLGSGVVNNTCATASPGHDLMVTDSGTLLSTDGSTWPNQSDDNSPDFAPSVAQGVILSCAAFGNNEFAATSSSDSYIHIYKGSTPWTVVDTTGIVSGMSYRPEAIIWIGSEFLAAGVAQSASKANVVLIASADGKSWSQVSATGLLTSAQAGTTSIAVRGLWLSSGHYYLMTDTAGTAQTLYASADGKTWSTATGVPTTVINAGPVPDGGFYVLTATNGRGYLTIDGTTWKTQTPTGIAAGSVIYAGAYAQGYGVVVGDDGSGNGVVYISTDGSTWTLASIGSATPGTLYTVSSDGCHFIAGGAQGDIVYGGTAPEVTNATLTTKENTSATGTLSATVCSASYAVSTKPTHGKVTLTNAATGAYSYVPTTGYSGSDGFAFTATDSQDGLVSTPASVAITVTASGTTGPSPKGSSGGGGAPGILGIGMLGLLTAIRRRVKPLKRPSFAER